MTVLDLFTPTKSRNFTYYDRCAILLDPDELRSVRLRVTVTILGSPVSRSLNLKYPYFKEFYGYAQFFFQETYYGESPINYSNQIIWDYWSEHATLAFQLSQVYLRQQKIFEGLLTFLVSENATSPSIDNLLIAQAASLTLPNGLANSFEVGSSYANTFIHPWNLLRLKFPFGTVFAVGIDSWTMVADEDLVVLPGNPITESPFDTDNPNGTTPEPTPGGRNPAEPYGEEPPESSPLDPNLDPNDFSNAPEPEPPVPSILVRAWFLPAIPGAQSEGFVVACADVPNLQAVPGFASATQEQDRGTACVPQNSAGGANGEDLEAAFPGFISGVNTNATGPECPSCS